MGIRARRLSAADTRGGNENEPQGDKGEGCPGRGAYPPVARDSGQYIPCPDRSSGEVMSGRRDAAADGGAVDVDGLARLLPGLDSFVYSLLFGDDDFQGVGHPTGVAVGLCCEIHSYAGRGCGAPNGCGGHPVWLSDVSG